MMRIQLNQRSRFTQSGFTLIEILIVMVIIGILATLGAGSFQSSQIKGRDARRKSDLKQIVNSLEVYYNDRKTYPLGSDGLIAGCAGLTPCSWGEQFSDENDTIYMVVLPSDPKSSLSYHYESDGTSYQLYARLENNLDMAVPKDAQDASQVFSGLACGSLECNYGVASSNTTPEAGRTLVTE